MVNLNYPVHLKAAEEGGFVVIFPQVPEAISLSKASAWRDVKPFKGAANRRSLFLDLAQRRALLAATAGALRHLLLAAMFTGCRAGELVGALCKQFDVRTSILTVTGKTGPRPVV